MSGACSGGAGKAAGSRNWTQRSPARRSASGVATYRAAPAPSSSEPAPEIGALLAAASAICERRLFSQYFSRLPHALAPFLGAGARCDAARHPAPRPPSPGHSAQASDAERGQNADGAEKRRGETCRSGGSLHRLRLCHPHSVAARIPAPRRGRAPQAAKAEGSGCERSAELTCERCSTVSCALRLNVAIRIRASRAAEHRHATQTRRERRSASQRAIQFHAPGPLGTENVRKGTGGKREAEPSRWREYNWQQ